MANSTDPDQTARAVWPGSVLFAKAFFIFSEFFGKFNLRQDIICRFMKQTLIDGMHHLRDEMLRRRCNKMSQNSHFLQIYCHKTKKFSDRGKDVSP